MARRSARKIRLVDGGNDKGLRRRSQASHAGQSSDLGSDAHSSASVGSRSRQASAARTARSASAVQYGVSSSQGSHSAKTRRAHTKSSSSQQGGQAARNLWEIGDNPSPESGFTYVSTKGNARRSVQQGAKANVQHAAQRTAVSQRSQSVGNRPSVAAGGRVRAVQAEDAGSDASTDGVELVSERVGDVRQKERAKRLRASSRRYFVRIFVVIGVVVALIAGWAALYNSSLFGIDNVTVNGVEHLTGDEMTQLANVPADTTLLRVDTDAIAERVRQNSWVQDVQINRIFPGTLEINVTERPVAAIVEIPISQGSAVRQWAIAQDHTWLMPIPDAGSEAAKTTSPKIYEDAKTVRHIVGVPYGTKAEIGQVCTDDNVNNALNILDGMTTDLADRVVKISAAGPAETTLVLDNNVEIAFGKAEDIRDKERVIEKILADNPDGVAYINVRMVENPTWRAI